MHALRSFCNGTLKDFKTATGALCNVFLTHLHIPVYNRTQQTGKSHRFLTAGLSIFILSEAKIDEALG